MRDYIIGVIIGLIAIAITSAAVYGICVGESRKYAAMHDYYQRHGYDITIDELKMGIRPCRCSEKTEKEQ
jgi:hypothetical protein